MRETEGSQARVGVDADIVERKARFGDANVEMLPLGVIVNLRQMRQEVDSEALADLKERIVLDRENGELHYNLVHPVTVNLLDREHIDRYLADHAEYYGESSELNLDELPTWNDYFVLRVSGHMRGEAAVSHCKDQGIDLENAFISAAIHFNEPFIDANRTQNIENSRVEVSPVDEARSIERYYHWCVQHGEPADFGAIGKYFGYSTKKVHAALRFVTAPADIQGFVGKGLSYSNVVALVRLREAYQESDMIRLRESGDVFDYEEVAQHAEQNMHKYFESTVLNRLRGRTSSYISEAIKAKRREVQKTATYYTDELFSFDVEAEQAAAQTRLRREMAGAAMQAISYLSQQGSLGPSDIEALEQLTQKVRLDAESSESGTPLF